VLASDTVGRRALTGVADEADLSRNKPTVPTRPPSTGPKKDQSK
jgi:hypothetical protein